MAARRSQLLTHAGPGKPSPTWLLPMFGEAAIKTLQQAAGSFHRNFKMAARFDLGLPIGWRLLPCNPVSIMEADEAERCPHFDGEARHLHQLAPGGNGRATKRPAEHTKVLSAAQIGQALWTEREKDGRWIPESTLSRFLEDRPEGAGHVDEDDGRGSADCAGSVRRRAVGAGRNCATAWQ
jgi:hypothetical protein